MVVILRQPLWDLMDKVGLRTIGVGEEGLAQV
jgi:hypothetical protein